MRLVMVEWLDSFGCSASWQDIGDTVATTPLKCRSVGWLMHDSPDCKVIVPHLSEPAHLHASQQGCGDMTIPACAVLRIVDLSELQQNG